MIWFLALALALALLLSVCRIETSAICPRCQRTVPARVSQVLLYAWFPRLAPRLWPWTCRACRFTFRGQTGPAEVEISARIEDE